MSRLSIIVPVLGDQSALDDTLISVLENRPADCQVLVVCPRQYRDPYALEDEVQFVPVDDGCEWPAMLNRGVERATGDLVHVLLPGVRATAQWERPVVAAFAVNPRTAAVAPRLDSKREPELGPTIGVTLTLGGRRQLLRCRSPLIRQSQSGCGPTCQAGFFRRSALIAVGGWNELIHPELADVELILRLNEHGYGCQVEAASKMDAPEPDRGHVAVGFRLAREMEQLYRTYVTPRHPLTVLTRHPLGLAAECIALLPQGAAFAVLAGRAAGCFGRLPGWQRVVAVDSRTERLTPDAFRPPE